MKMILLVLAALFSVIGASGQEGKYSTYYYQRATLFEALPTDTTDIIFLGNSITDGGEWLELLADARCKNRGISGDSTEGVYDRLGVITGGQPDKVFLLIGINDLGRGATLDAVFEGIAKILERIQTESPRTEIFLQSILPVNDCYGMFEGHTARWAEIRHLNCRLSLLAKARGVTFVDLYHHFVLPTADKLDPQYSNDGLHLLGSGYIRWVEMIRPYL